MTEFVSTLIDLAAAYRTSRCGFAFTPACGSKEAASRPRFFFLVGGVCPFPITEVVGFMERSRGCAMDVRCREHW